MGWLCCEKPCVKPLASFPLSQALHLLASYLNPNQFDLRAIPSALRCAFVLGFMQRANVDTLCCSLTLCGGTKALGLHEIRLPGQTNDHNYPHPFSSVWAEFSLTQPFLNTTRYDRLYRILLSVPGRQPWGYTKSVCKAKRPYPSILFPFVRAGLLPPKIFFFNTTRYDTQYCHLSPSLRGLRHHLF